jgi:hypothetical protein
LILLSYYDFGHQNIVQRSGLAAVWEIEFRLPKTEVVNCNIVDVLFISQIYNVLLELKLNSSRNVEVYYVCPNCSKPLVGCWQILEFFKISTIEFVFYFSICYFVIF